MVFKDADGNKYSNIVIIDEDVDEQLIKDLAKIANCKLNTIQNEEEEEEEDNDENPFFIIDDQRKQGKKSRTMVIQRAYRGEKYSNLVLSQKSFIDLVLECNDYHVSNVHLIYIGNKERDKEEEAIKYLIEQMDGIYIEKDGNRPIKHDWLSQIIEFQNCDSLEIYAPQSKKKKFEKSHIISDEEEEEEEEDDDDDE